MYRDDLAATHARVEALQVELATAQTRGALDQHRIAMMQQQLQTMQQTIARLGGHAPQQHFVHAPRGNAILALGICSLVLCSLLGPIAWAMGNDEMRRIRMGLTPSDAETATSAGRVCGIVATAILFLLMLVLVVVLASTRHAQGF